MRISDWSSDVCSSDLLRRHVATVHLLLPCGGDHIACRQRPMERAALQSLRIALKAQILLCGSENDALRGPRVRFTERHDISQSHPGVSTLQSTDTENIPPLLFLSRSDGRSGRRALANAFEEQKRAV